MFNPHSNPHSQKSPLELATAPAATCLADRRLIPGAECLARLGPCGAATPARPLFRAREVQGVDDDQLDDIQAAAYQPRRVKGDMGEVEEHPIADVVRAEKEVAKARAGRKRTGGIGFTQMLPPGAV